MHIKSSIRDYNLDFIKPFKNQINEIYKEGDFIVVDSKVVELYNVNNILNCNHRHIISIEATEQKKSYTEIAPIIQYLIENGFRKNNRLIAIGGGVIQDITAFISSIMFRGVDWILYPTTLLGQCDSCIGSKTSINFGKYKNQIGNFYSPKQIYIDVTFLKTLQNKDLISGLGEMAHYYFVSSSEDMNYYKENYLKALNNFNILEELIKRSLEIKKKYIEIDEFDENERQIFNYGHSFGHAIESLTNYEIPHGVAVSIGMDISNFISVKYGYLSIDDRYFMRGILEEVWQGYSIQNINIEDMEKALSKDKKNKGSLLGLILTRGAGKAFKVFKELDSDFSSWLSEYFDIEFEQSRSRDNV